MRTRSFAIVALVGVLGTLHAATTASATWAEPSYRYWSYWTTDGSGWTFAQQGPATRPAADGTAEAWSFGVSTAAGSPELAPSMAPADAFSQGCGGTPSRPGAVRVAILADPGTGPVVRCAVVDDGSSSAQALSAVFDLRVENGLVCAIDGTPTSGCAELVDGEPTEAASAPPTAAQPAAADETGVGAAGVGLATSPWPTSPWPTLAVIAVIAIGVVLARRRRS